MLRKSRSNLEHHDHLLANPLPTAKRVVQVPSTPFNAAMIPLQFGTKEEDATQANAATPLPPSAPAPIQLPSTDLTSLLSRQPSKTAIRSSRQSRDSAYNALIASSNNNVAPSPRASNIFDPTPTSTSSIEETNIPTVSIAELIGDRIDNLETIPSKWTLTDLINYIIDNEIILPTEEEIDGNRAANAAALPVLDTPAFYDEYEDKVVEFARANAGLKPTDDWGRKT